jgi:hypothetical protein
MSPPNSKNRSRFAIAWRRVASCQLVAGRWAEIGWNVGRIARAWAELMHRLGYTPTSRRAAT